MALCYVCAVHYSLFSVRRRMAAGQIGNSQLNAFNLSSSFVHTVAPFVVVMQSQSYLAKCIHFVFLLFSMSFCERKKTNLRSNMSSNSFFSPLFIHSFAVSQNIYEQFYVGTANYVFIYSNSLKLSRAQCALCTAHAHAKCQMRLNFRFVSFGKCFLQSLSFASLHHVNWLINASKSGQRLFAILGLTISLVCDFAEISFIDSMSTRNMVT